MASKGFEQSVGRMRHVAIVTLAAAGIWRMVRVGLKPVTVGIMTLKTRFIRFHVRAELVVRSALVHRMTGKTRELAPLITGRFNQAVILTT